MPPSIVSMINELGPGKTFNWTNQDGFFTFERPKYGNIVFISKYKGGIMVQISKISLKKSY